MLASPAHLYMPHLFTHCLRTIICVMLIFYESLFYFAFVWLVFSVTCCVRLSFVFVFYFEFGYNDFGYVVTLPM